MYLLDTNILSYWMRGDEALIARIKRYSPSDLAFTAISLAEIQYGIEKSPVKKRVRTAKLQAIAAQLDIYPFDKIAAPHYADIRAQLEKAGQPISERDTQIAAIARANKLTIVTHNTREFTLIPRLEVQDWAPCDGSTY
ncbi:MAG: type II toxin-antitoxin system VapC family toxin [Myxococcota bacterium]|nr:type II toxin-antitoxin system VapC family toxin [Myxococcota bacterium]